MYGAKHTLLIMRTLEYFAKCGVYWVCNTKQPRLAQRKLAGRFVQRPHFTPCRLETALIVMLPFLPIGICHQVGMGVVAQMEALCTLLFHI